MPRSDPASEVLELTRGLVAIDSVSPSLAPGAPGEAAIAAFAADRLDAAGFAVRCVTPAADPRRVSVIAVRDGPRQGATVVLNGHLDTVGVEGMDDPFTARAEDDRLSGRGTSDMKGGVAGIIVAAGLLAAAGAPGRIIVTLVADEEDASLGAVAVIDDLIGEATRMDACLIAEPTWLDLAVAHRGYGVAVVEMEGRAAHSSQPGEGIDALKPLGDLLVAVAGRDHELHGVPEHPLLAHGSLMTTVARGGTAAFTIAAHAEAVIERRTLPGESPTAAYDDVRALVDAVVAGAPGVRAHVRPKIARDAWEMDAAGPAAALAEALAASLAATGAPPRRVGAPYWMESALWQAAGVPTVVCGPAGGGLHAVDEWVDLTQLRRFPVALADAVGKFLEAS
ncbi:acetylornithine deacetylase [Microbacterium sp. cf046]|uniref:M20/M25/M40 family metallo-hydrolase n=1 Tax=Microbacterium sp. cf046 TaxID=1761803 RepID=UPI0008F05101|nr:M20/M25/M40 family metallo-hydrolase [Microbacterium sp. cf046]SFR92740.1 acetylornithine deacetylase [Microbacterium sp. cf046]